MNKIQLFDRENFNKTECFDSPELILSPKSIIQHIILNYGSFIQDFFVEKSVATVFVCPRAQKDLKTRAGCYIHFKFSQPHARLVCLPTNIFVLQISALGSGMFLNLLQKGKRSIIHGKTSFFAFPIKTSPSRRKSTKKTTNRTIYTNRRKGKAISYMPSILTRKECIFYK